jgi:hypothetical protein
MAHPRLRRNVVGRLKRAPREGVAAPADRARPEEGSSESGSESEVEQRSLRRSTREKRKASDEGGPSISRVPPPGGKKAPARRVRSKVV